MPITSALSILDPNRPELNRTHDGTGTYTFNPRIKPVEFSLGWELEANHSARRMPDGIQRMSDGSVNGHATEYVVMTTVVKSPRYVLGLLKDLVHSPELNTDSSCGFHVHISPRNTTLKVMRQWALACQDLALAIEEEAFNAVPSSRKENQYCKRIVRLAEGHRFFATKYSNPIRYHWLNVVEMFRPHGIRTIEVRLLGNTHRWKYLSAWSLFTLTLGKEAWYLMHSLNYAVRKEGATQRLKDLLLHITEEIKPLDKRGEPVPQWVYEGFKRHGIDPSAWEKPLAKVRDAESEVKEERKRYYSDAQATIEPENDEEDNSCSCGCGEEGRCYTQMHSDGDCDSNYCSECCSEGNCDGAGHCDSCQESAHSLDEDCTRPRCVACIRDHRGVQVRASVVDESTERARLNNVVIDNVTVNATPHIISESVYYGRSVVSTLFDTVPTDPDVTGYMTSEEVSASTERVRALYHAGNLTTGGI